jgi:dipicolinate synthase subunit B
MNIGFAMCGSFCTFARIFPVLEALASQHTVTPIFSQTVCNTNSRFGTAEEFMTRVEQICGQKVLCGIPQVEPIGPKKLLDALVIAPCTGNTLAKLAHGIADGPVTMATKSHLRNGRPVLLGISTNDGLSSAAENIGRLLNRKHFYFVPFGQDDPEEKPCSLVAEFEKLPQALEMALIGMQLQPLLSK